MPKKIFYALILFILSSIIIIIGLEIMFRIWRPPQLQIQGQNILLTKNKITENNYSFNSDKLQNHIIIKRNSLGFRGPEPPLDFNKHLTLIAVGGSTTECIFITEGKTWTDYLETNLISEFPNIWINNAGIDGHSTFGHIALMKQYIGHLKPNYVLFLVGINDMAIQKNRPQDQNQIVEKENPIKNKSMILSYLRYLKSKKGTHDFTALTDSILTNQDIINTKVQFNLITDKDIINYQTSLTEYKKRLETLISLTKNYSIKPILVTQPAVYGFGIDKTTGVDLGNIIVSDFTEEGTVRKGSDKWKLLELYNQTTKEVANEFNIPVIDLAQEMPKNTLYYYDYIHFTEKGTYKVGEILSKNLINILEK